MMVAASRAQPFPRGVADTAKNRAYVRDPSGYLVALDTSTGKLLWRTEAAYRPLYVDGERLVALRVESANALRVVCLNVDDGQESVTANPLAFPDWVKITLEDTADFSLHFENEQDTVVLYWSAHTRYRGGAAPSAKVLKASQRDEVGQFRVNLDTGESQIITPTNSTASEATSEHQSESLLPDVLEQRFIGDICYQILARQSAGIVKTIVKALSTKDERTLWETIISEAAARRPPPLRP